MTYPLPIKILAYIYVTPAMILATFLAFFIVSWELAEGLALWVNNYVKNRRRLGN